MPHKKKKRHATDDSFSSESSSDGSVAEEDPYEKLLEYNGDEDTFLVKLRNKSYLHCMWVR